MQIILYNTKPATHECITCKLTSTYITNHKNGGCNDFEKKNVPGFSS